MKSYVFKSLLHVALTSVVLRIHTYTSVLRTITVFKIIQNNIIIIFFFILYSIVVRLKNQSRSTSEIDDDAGWR